jgi:hypothetical protein
VFEGIKAAILKDRDAYFKDFLDNFYNVDKLAPDRIRPGRRASTSPPAPRRMPPTPASTPG